MIGEDLDSSFDGDAVSTVKCPICGTVTTTAGIRFGRKLALGMWENGRGRAERAMTGGISEYIPVVYSQKRADLDPAVSAQRS
jgi:hypothetical protein